MRYHNTLLARNILLYVVIVITCLAVYSLLDLDDGTMMWRFIALTSLAYAVLSPTVIITIANMRMTLDLRPVAGLVLCIGWTFGMCVLWAVIMLIFIRIMSGGLV